MKKFVVAAGLAALIAPGVAQAAIRLKPVNYCPAPANYSFKVLGARGEYDGVASEYQWLAATLPGWKRDAQSLLEDKRGRAFDVLDLSKGRKKLSACFDITDLYGKSG